jgi:predicted enzyme related to lactoylglutathione lyase
MVPFDKAHGYPSHWVGYVAVENCDAMVKRMEQLGGKICCPPYEAPGVGRFALINDPQGAIIKPFQPARPMPLPETPEVGQVCWNELVTSDLDKAMAFYVGAFGWETAVHDFGPPMGKYTLFRAGGKDAGGAMTLPPGVEKPHWLFYFLADDVDARTRKAGEIGAKVCVEPRDIPGIGRFSVVADPCGATFALFKSSRG